MYLYYITNIWIFFICFSHVFLTFHYWNFDVGIFVLKSETLVQASKKIFGMRNKRTGKMRVGGMRGVRGWGGELRVPNKHWQGGSVVVRKNKKITSKGRRLFGSQKYFLSVYKVGRSDKEVLEMVSLIPCYTSFVNDRQRKSR